MYTIATFAAIVAAVAAAPQSLTARQGPAYQPYRGDGLNGWPAESEWQTFDQLWATNSEFITSTGCGAFSFNFGQAVTPNSADEASQIQSAIQSVAGEASVDPRFVLAVVVQESKGCARAWETSNANRNPGLMQSNNGASCNTAKAVNGQLQTPGEQSVPCTLIEQMIRDGTQGTASGEGLRGSLDRAQGSTTAQDTYMAAVNYNSGSVPADGDLSSPNVAGTQAYASDIANRLRGVFFDQSQFS